MPYERDADGHKVFRTVLRVYSNVQLTSYIFERKVYRRILGPVYDNKKENWRILTNK